MKSIALGRNSVLHGSGTRTRPSRSGSLQVDVEPMTGIEPAYSAWEADVLPLNYIGIVANEG
jgi:hypothetical protein